MVRSFRLLKTSCLLLSMVTMAAFAPGCKQPRVPQEQKVKETAQPVIPEHLKVLDNYWKRFEDLGGEPGQVFKSCIETVVANCVFQASVSAVRATGDSSLCADLKEPYMVENCRFEAARSAALSKKTTDPCKALDKEEAIRRCVTEVAQTLALETSDPKTCNLIPNEEGRGMCRKQVFGMMAMSVTEPEGCSKIEEATARRECQLRFAINAGLRDRNPEACNAVEDSEGREACRMQVVREKALAEDKPEICKTLKEPGDCLDAVTYQRAVKTMKPELCKAIRSAISKWQCMVEAGREAMAKDALFCAQIEDQPMRRHCWTLAFERVDKEAKSPCEGLKDASLRQECKDRFLFQKAVAVGDRDLCKEISQEADARMCREVIEYGSKGAKGDLPPPGPGPSPSP